MQFYGKALHPVSSALKGIMEFALEMNPAEMLRQGLQGTGLWGKHLSAQQRATTLAWLNGGSVVKGGFGLAKFGGAKFMPFVAGMLKFQKDEARVARFIKSTALQHTIDGKEVTTVLNELVASNHYQGYREAKNLIASGAKEYKNWYAKSEAEARAFMESVGLQFTPGNYPNLGHGTFQLHPEEANAGVHALEIAHMRHFKYSFGKGMSGHIWFPD